jgi:hypothetical protein
MKIKESDIVDAVKDSADVEVSKDNKQIRRKGNKALPVLEKKGDGVQKKRDAKAASKEEKKGDDEAINLDEKGNVILANADFENPAIIHFKTAGKEGDTYKVNWKEVENEVKANFPGLKIVYSRAD